MILGILVSVIILAWLWTSDAGISVKAGATALLLWIICCA